MDDDDPPPSFGRGSLPFASNWSSCDMAHSETRRLAVKPKLVPLPQAFPMLGIGRTKGFSLISAGVLETVTLGKRRYARMDSIERLVRDGYQSAEPPARRHLLLE